MNGASRINRAREEREVDASQETRAPPARAHLSRLYDRCGTVRVPRIIWHASPAAHEYSLYVYICAYICIEYRPTSSKRWRNDGWERRWAKRTELGRWFVYIDADRTRLIGMCSLPIEYLLVNGCSRDVCIFGVVDCG